MPTYSYPNQVYLLSLLKADKKEKQSLDITSGINVLPRIFWLGSRKLLLKTPEAKFYTLLMKWLFNFGLVGLFFGTEKDVSCIYEAH